MKSTLNASWQKKYITICHTLLGQMLDGKDVWRMMYVFWSGLHKSSRTTNIIFSRMNIIFSVMLEISSLGVFFRKRSSLLFWQKGNFIFVGKRNTTFTSIQKTSYFHVFFEKYHFSFSVRKKDIMFSGRKKCHLPLRYFKDHIPVQFFWKGIFSEHIKNISYFHVFFLRKIIFHLPPKE